MTVLTQGASPGLPRNATNAQIIDQQNRLLSGALNCNAALTLSTGTTTTTFTDARIGPNSSLPLTPKSSNAAGALATTFPSTVTKGYAIFTHSNNTQTDRTFRVAILGG